MNSTTLAELWGGWCASSCEKLVLGGWTVTPGDRRYADQKITAEAVYILFTQQLEKTAALWWNTALRCRIISTMIKINISWSLLFKVGYNLHTLLQKKLYCPTVCGGPTSSINRLWTIIAATIQSPSGKILLGGKRNGENKRVSGENIALYHLTCWNGLLKENTTFILPSPGKTNKHNHKIGP